MTESARVVQEVGVDIVKESWNEYVLEDGTKLRARVILLKLHWPIGVDRLSNCGDAEIGFTSQNVVTAFSPDRLKNDPSPKLPSVDEIKADESEDVRILGQDEQWNEYSIEGNKGNIRLKLVATQVIRVRGYYTKDRAPYYILRSTIVPAAAPNTT